MTHQDPAEQKREQAALYVLSALGDEEAQTLERELETSPALKSEVQAFRQITDELAFSARCITPPPSLKERLMARLAHEPRQEDDSGTFTFVRSGELDWRNIGVGVAVKVLFFDPAAGRLTTLMKMAPGSRYGAHVHAQMEEIYVVEGSCVCAGRPLQAGDYFRAEPRSTHSATYSEGGCLALIMTSSKNKPIGPTDL
ncbi:cupin domain-containing protein [Nitrospira sp. Nam80]